MSIEFVFLVSTFFTSFELLGTVSQTLILAVITIIICQSVTNSPPKS